MPALLRQLALGAGVVLVQWLVFQRLPLWGVVPDVVLLFVALRALQYGRVAGAVTGFGAGLFLDLLLIPSGGALGLHAMLKTVMGFVIGFFRSDQGDKMRIDPIQAFVGALVGGFLATLLGLGSVSGFNFVSFVIAILGSLLLLFTYRKLRTA